MFKCSKYTYSITIYTNISVYTKVCRSILLQCGMVKLFLCNKSKRSDTQVLMHACVKSL